jgi:hypothetical protein
MLVSSALTSADAVTASLSGFSDVQRSFNDRQALRAFKHDLANGIGENCRLNHLQICDTVALPTHPLDEGTDIASQYLFLCHSASLITCCNAANIFNGALVVRFRTTRHDCFFNGFPIVTIFLQMLTSCPREPQPCYGFVGVEPVPIVRVLLS